MHQTKKLNNNKKHNQRINSINYTAEYSLLTFEFNRIKDWTHKTSLRNFKTKPVQRTSKKVVTLTGSDDTSPRGGSVATEPRGRRGRGRVGRGRGAGPAPPPYYLINSPPLVYSASRYDDDVKFLNFSKRAATFTYSLIL